MLNENIKILAASPMRQYDGECLSRDTMLKLARAAKESSTVMITDYTGEALRAFRSRDIPIYHVVQSMDVVGGYASNNWRKMHGYPVRRKMYNEMSRKTRRWNRKRSKQQRPICVRLALDKTNTAFQVGYEAD